MTTRMRQEQCTSTAMVFWKTCTVVFSIFLIVVAHSPAQTAPHLLRAISGVVVTDDNEVLPNVSVVAEYSSGTTGTTTDANGKFWLDLPDEPTKLKVLGNY